MRKLKLTLGLNPALPVLLISTLAFAPSCVETPEGAQSRALADQRAYVAAQPLTAQTLECKGVEILKEQVNKYETVIFHDGCRILFDQQSIQQASPDAPAVGLYADVWEFRAPRTGRYAISYLPIDLNGKPGEAGPHGDNRDRNTRSRQPQPGGHGADGGPGDPGRSLNRLARLVIYVGKELRDPEGLLGEEDIARLQVTIDASGLTGGAGGAGGVGGNGGAGESGENALIRVLRGGSCRNPDIECVPEPTCVAGPTPGAPGGNAGRGGRGGRGADGGNASSIEVAAPSKIAGGIERWAMRMEGGSPGAAGKPGQPGQPGPGGFPGNDRSGWCNGDAAPGANGIVPQPSDLGAEQPGTNSGRSGIVTFNRLP